MTRVLVQARLTAAVLASLIALAGCYLPVHFVEPASPLLSGTYLGSDGQPVAGARVAVTSHTYDDAHCRRATVRATTDSAGRFHFQSTTIERKGILLVPAIERFFNAYAICTGATDSSLRIAYIGRVPLRAELVPPDTVSCLQWMWEGRARSVCSGSSENPVQVGGSWSDGSSNGYYRLINTGPGWDGRESGVFLQWVERDARDGAQIVRQTIAFPLAPKLLDVSAALISPPGRSACVRVRSAGRPRHWYSWDQTRLDVSVELGPPGVSREMRESCSLAR
ncbi:MAG: carboxypeptidase-like regulatory domain-containing protein [Gemmatimonadaceae bacterium]